MSCIPLTGVRSKCLFSQRSFFLLCYKENVNKLLLPVTKHGFHQNLGFYRKAKGNALFHGYYKGVENIQMHNACRRILWYWSSEVSFGFKCTCRRLIHNDSSQPPLSSTDPEKKLSIFQRFKSMYRDYWYVLVPVHLITSAIWFGSFYALASSGFDIAELISHFNFSDEVIEKIRKNSTSVPGYLAISYLLYKIITPLRYTVTLAGTTVSINYLTKWGYIKPMPKKYQLRKMLEEKKETIRAQTKLLKERRDNMKNTVLYKLSNRQRGKALRRDHNKRPSILDKLPNKKN